MADNTRDMKGKRVLVVEDEYLIATDLARALEDHGIEVVGPAGSVQEAIDLIENGAGQLDAAVLDVNVRGERVFPVAEALTIRKVPYVFATGYDDLVIPASYANIPRCQKPVETSRLLKLLSAPAR